MGVPNPPIQHGPHQILGHRKDGRPIHTIAGGAADDFAAWIPEETDSAVIQRVAAMSAVEAVARHTPMASETKKEPRSSGMTVSTLSKSGTYTSSDDEDDDVLLTARKHTGLLTVADEDLSDSAADIITTKKTDWATSYSKYFDNATLATTGAESMPTVPYTSVLKALSTDNADTGYTALANVVETAVVGAPTYDELSTVFSLYEDGDYFDESNTVVIASPAFRKALRGVKDLQDMPIFVRGQGSDSGTPDTLFNAPIRWTTGARTSATASASPTGSPILVVCNSDYLIVGDRSVPESQPIPAAISLTDEANIKMRVRKGFAVGHEKAFAVLVDSGEGGES